MGCGKLTLRLRNGRWSCSECPYSESLKIISPHIIGVGMIEEIMPPTDVTKKEASRILDRVFKRT